MTSAGQLDAREAELDARLARLEAEAQAREDRLENEESRLRLLDERLAQKESELSAYVGQVQGCFGTASKPPRCRTRTTAILEPPRSELIAFRMISAPSAASAGSASSSGAWLIPSLHGTKTIALGTSGATQLRVVPRAGRHEAVRLPVASAAASSAATTRLVHAASPSCLPLRVRRAHARRSGRLIGEGRDVPRDAPVDASSSTLRMSSPSAGLAGDHVDDAGLDLALTGRPDGAAPGCAREALELEDALGRDGGGVLAEVHRRRAGVVGTARTPEVGPEQPTIAVTMPIRSPVSWSTRPCSMCSSIQPTRSSSTWIDSRHRAGS